MTLNKIAPALMIAISLASALGYLPQKDWRHILYWVCAATITYVVTY